MQSKEERQAELRERARRLLIEARKGSTSTTEIIRLSPEPVESFDDAEQKLQKIGEQVAELERQSSSGKYLNMQAGVMKCPHLSFH